MITPQRMSEFEKNKIIDIFSKLNQDLTSSIIKKLQQLAKKENKILRKMQKIRK